MLEQAADSCKGTYQARALLSLGNLEAANQNLSSEAQYYLEAFKASHDLSTKVEAARGIAVIKAKEGYHKHAVSDFERFLPLAARCDAITYNLYLSSLAVELGEAGRKDEARNVSRIVLASPFTHAYPEWRETADALKEPNHSLITVPSIEYEHVEIEPPAKVLSIESHPDFEPEEPARVISFPGPGLREAPRPTQPKRVKRDELSEMTPSQKRELLLLGIKSGRIVEGEYNKLLFISGMIESGPSEQVIDLEDKKLLNELITRWANLIEPEELTAVMSALRDCKDELRQANIIDDIIRKAFEYSATCDLTEAEWRTKVECKLPEK
jgi:tetratricopeptide (TPR) repeat protein